MKFRYLVLLVLVAGLAAFAGYRIAGREHTHAHADDAPAARKVKFYQSPMHPWIKSDQPGKCTICGMALAPVYEGEADAVSEDGLVVLAPAAASVIGVQSTEIRRASLVRTLRVTGIIDHDETRQRTLASYTDARIEKLLVNTTGVDVQAGQLIAVVYSPDLLTARQEFHALARISPDSSLASAAREKLRRLGLLNTQIDALVTEAKVSRETEILAPLAGTVIARSPSAYEGSYVKSGETLFTLGDLKTMWFVFDAYETDLAALRVGQSIEVATPSLPGQTFTASIAFIDPNLDATTRAARVRVVLDNTDGHLRRQLTASARVTIESADVLLAPRSALLHTQNDPLVYVERSDRTYASRTVRTGRIGDEFIEIIEGLKPGDRVVTQGALLIDGQAQLAHSATPPLPSPASASSETTALPVPLVLATADAAGALANDDLAAYAKLIPELINPAHFSDEAHGTLRSLAQKLTAGPDLETARATFEPFSTAVADAVRSHPAGQRENLHVFQCPMTPVLGTGRWLQRSGALKNPFFGSEMLECGEELK